MNMTMKLWIWIGCISVVGILGGWSGAHVGGLDALQSDFQQPPADTRPGCYWYWINDNISKAGISKDLEAMARVGIGRAYIGHIFNYGGPNDTPVGDVQFMTEAWWEAVQWAVKEGDRCGVEIGFFNSPGWSQSGGPWVGTDQSMRFLAYSETVVQGGKRVDQVIPAPEITTYPNAGGSRAEATAGRFTEKEFQDVRLIAFRRPETETNDINMKQVKVTCQDIADIQNLLDGSAETAITLPGNKDCVINLVLPDSALTRSGIQHIGIKPLDWGYHLRCRVESSEDGQTWRQVGDYTEERGHQGAKNRDLLVAPVSATKAKYLRLTLWANKAIRLAELTVSRGAALGGYVRKQLGETSPSTRPAWNAYLWEAQAEPIQDSVVVSDDAIDLTDKMDKTGRLVWNAPPGQWVVLRMGMAPTGTMCAPASPESRGLEVDKMNKAHVRSLFDGMVGEFLRRTPPAERKALKYVIADSYETGPQNWTDDFISKFQKRYGYSPERYLPVLTGRVVDSAEISNRFLWDMRRLIVESIAYDYVGGLREVANENDLTVWLENYGHWGFPSEFLLYGSQTNQVGAEFWATNNPLGNVECRAAASCAHTYGKDSVYAEAFTSGVNFKHSLASLKNWCDWVYGAGVNHLILHVYIHQPDERKPGIIQWFGTAFNRHNTWFEQSGPFIDYTRRCSVMLKAGLPVIDVAYYIGEDAPMMQGPRDPGLPDGYDFDYINSDALIKRATVKAGRIVMPDGPSYAVLVLPRLTTMRPEVARAIMKLVQAGATIIGPRPQVSPSLQNYPQCDLQIAQIARDVWGSIDGKAIISRQFGQGRVYDGVELDTVLRMLGIAADVSVVENEKLLCSAAGAGKIGIGGQGGLVYKHRKVGEADIYFLANTSGAAVDFVASLRQSGLRPWLWDAITGTMQPAAAFSQREGRTLVPLHLEPSESVFVVLDGKIGGNIKGPGDTNEPAYQTVAALDGEWMVHFNGQGAPETMVFDSLTDWSKNENLAIRHYAGTAVYQKTFNLDQAVVDKPLMLELGEAGVIATVYVNGQRAGTAWTTPWSVEISGLVKSGENELEIRVANTWNNRLVGDAALPQEQRQSYVSQPYRFDKNAPLVKSGLMGPVVVKCQQ